MRKSVLWFWQNEDFLGSKLLSCEGNYADDQEDEDEEKKREKRRDS